LIFAEAANAVGLEKHDVDDADEMNAAMVEAVITSAIRGPAMA
jgi:hypothetical protein